MKFSQAMAKLEENQKLKFKDQYGFIVSLNENGYLVLKRNGVTTPLDWSLKVASSQCLKADNWEEAQEPVDFMMAFKAWQEGKLVSLKVEDDLSRRKQVRKDYCTMNFNMRDVESGKWYIEC